MVDEEENKKSYDYAKRRISIILSFMFFLFLFPGITFVFLVILVTFLSLGTITLNSVFDIVEIYLIVYVIINFLFGYKYGKKQFSKEDRKTFKEQQNAGIDISDKLGVRKITKTSIYYFIISFIFILLIFLLQFIHKSYFTDYTKNDYLQFGNYSLPTYYLVSNDNNAFASITLEEDFNKYTVDLIDVFYLKDGLNSKYLDKYINLLKEENEFNTLRYCSGKTYEEENVLINEDNALDENETVYYYKNLNDENKCVFISIASNQICYSIINSTFDAESLYELIDCEN